MRKSSYLARLSHRKSVCPFVRSLVRLSQGWISQKRFTKSPDFHRQLTGRL